MKKRAFEAAAVLAVLILLFAAVNLIAEKTAQSTVKIDGDYYNTGISEITLNLMTEEGLENLAAFPRLVCLKITPFKEAAANAAAGNDPAARAAVLSEYPDCTELSDLSAISKLTSLEKLDVSCCHVKDLSFAADMLRLTSLNIGHTQISDLSPLTEYPLLERLNIYCAPITDLSPLTEMESLDTLILSKETAEKFPHIISALEEKGVKIEAKE